jgi:anti-sigma factor RsiW
MPSGEGTLSAACQDVRDVLEAYVLDAIEPRQRAIIEAHLSTCLSCARDAADLAEAAHVLARQVPQVEPPAGLRARVLAAATAVESPALAERTQAAAPIAPSLISSPRPPITPTPHPAVAAPPRRPAAVSRLRIPLAAIAAAVAVASLAWAGTLQAQLSSQQAAFERLERRSERYDRIVAVLQSPELRVAALSGTQDAPGAEGRLMIDPSSETGMLVVRNLPPVPLDRAYQLWYVSDSGRRSGGVVHPDEQGNGYFFVRVPRDLDPYRDVGMTEEPASGSEGPTGQRVLRGAL